jgi:hypothetical protein
VPGSEVRGIKANRRTRVNLSVRSGITSPGRTELRAFHRQDFPMTGYSIALRSFALYLSYQWTSWLDEMLFSVRLGQPRTKPDR